jgi:hypothetical protein
VSAERQRPAPEGGTLSPSAGTHSPLIFKLSRRDGIHPEFIDQAHFRTICTRVQYAAHQ